MIYVVVEGPSDEGFIEGIAKRIGVTEIKVHRMRGNRLDKLRRLVNALYTEGKVIVLKDEHWNPSFVYSVERGLGRTRKSDTC